MNEQSADHPVELTGIAGPDSGNLERSKRELVLLMIAWLLLAITTAALAKQNLMVPGLYYDEAVFAGMAKDFLIGQTRGRHMPNYIVGDFRGRPFPVFVQPYLGALKSWMLIPSFSLFGISVSVLRVTNLCWALAALLLFMLATWRWLGLRTALIAGGVLALDPTYFFLGLLDWGAAVPSFVCRCACFYLIVIWSQKQRAIQLFFAAFFAGLGLFNKVDFAVSLLGVTIAGIVCYGLVLWKRLRKRPLLTALGCFGFLLGAGPMLFKLPWLVIYGVSGKASSGPAELSEKLHTAMSMYDGSYFYRLMSVGGMFSKMFQTPTDVQSTAGVIAVIASIIWLLATIGSKREKQSRTGRLLLLAIGLTTIGVFLLPGAVRIHHAVLVLALPQLIVAVALSSVLDLELRSTWLRWTSWMLVAAAIIAILTNELWAISKTQRLIRETGGRGLWSDSLETFCRENKHRTDLKIVSLDWGFNEQLAFLTNGPKLFEPVWELGHTIPKGTPLVRDPGFVYLVHPPKYAVAPESVLYSHAAENGDDDVEIQPYFDRQGAVAFYTIHFPPQ